MREIVSRLSIMLISGNLVQDKLTVDPKKRFPIRVSSQKNSSRRFPFRKTDCSANLKRKYVKFKAQ